MPDPFPSSDAEFTHWLERYVETLAGSPACSPLSESQKAALVQALHQWKSAYGACLAAEAAAARALEARLKSAAAVDAAMNVSPVAPPEGSLILLEASIDIRPRASLGGMGGRSVSMRTLGAS